MFVKIIIRMIKFLLTRYTDLTQLNNLWNYLKQTYLKKNSKDFKIKF